ncbi:pyrokinin-1 receptor [Eupeodes corollae]|uniref:pyrokinin-1 receptor n=1 Tax=Eupeodes corollae TaxID=290404 RepID=UPI00249352F1|nr:pyrokinin-1 receptor [Eupeodes corollae]XP_055902227.1 pyrokinin-1 receptor [Eupeodes corollae]
MDEYANITWDLETLWNSYNRANESLNHFLEMINHTTVAPNITDIFGPTRDSLHVVIPVTIIYSLIFVTGVVGNISTCIVIRKHRSMHTATNYYLFSLAISDFLLLISGVPQEVYFIWSKWPYVFGEVFCVGRGVLAETSANATVLTITAFTVERYVAICHPFLAHAMSKLNRATKIILLIWLISLLTALPQAAQFGVNSFFGVKKCTVVRIIVEYSFQLSTFLFFFAPMTIILVLYLLIGVKLHQANSLKSNGNILYRSGNGSSVRSKNQQGTKRVLKMLVAVVIAFFLCWAPFHAQRLIAVYGGDGLHNSIVIKLYNVMTYISGVLYYLSTCINPLLYNIMSNKFRGAFKETFQCFGGRIISSSSFDDEQSRQKHDQTRSQRLRTALHESDFTSSSQREESNQSTTSWRLNHPLAQCTLGEDQSLTKLPYCDRKATCVATKEWVAIGDNVIKIDEFDLPSKEASLNVLYGRDGEIEIRLMRHKKSASEPVRKIWSRITQFCRTNSVKSSARAGFYTPPIDEIYLNRFDFTVALKSQPDKHQHNGFYGE